MVVPVCVFAFSTCDQLKKKELCTFSPYMKNTNWRCVRKKCCPCLESRGRKNWKKLYIDELHNPPPKYTVRLSSERFNERHVSTDYQSDNRTRISPTNSRSWAHSFTACHASVLKYATSFFFLIVIGLSVIQRDLISRDESSRSHNVSHLRRLNSS